MPEKQVDRTIEVVNNGFSLKWLLFAALLLLGGLVFWQTRLVAPGTATSSAANPVALIRAGQYAEAVKILTAQAEAGQAKAQANLGVLYAQGLGVNKDLAQARYWLERSAEQDFLDGISNLGTLYSDLGEHDKALATYQQAAARGDRWAMYNLGVMYDVGRGVAQDWVMARDWYRQAAEREHANAQFNLGVMLARGEGGATDVAAAVQWWEKSAAQGNEAAKKALRMKKRADVLRMVKRLLH